MTQTLAACHLWPTLQLLMRHARHIPKTPTEYQNWMFILSMRHRLFGDLSESSGCYTNKDRSHWQIN